MVTINSWGSANPAEVAKGGTGAATLTGVLVGSGTSAVTATALTQYNVITGGASNAPNSVAPSATSGVPVISQGASSQPVFGTAVVAGGGTGLTSATAYAVVCGGTTTTGAFQSIAALGSSGNVLTSNGAGALPTFQAAAGGGATRVIIQTFTSTGAGTYTPTSGMLYCVIECIGAGGGGCGTGVSTFSVCGSGGGGGYSRIYASAATIGASIALSVGAGGTAGSGTVSTGAGGTGGTTSVGSTLLQATGGVGGTGSSTGSVTGGAGGTGSIGTLNIPGGTGGVSGGAASTSQAGYGGAAPIIGIITTPSWASSGSAVGVAGTTYGSGGTGPSGANAAKAGGVGGNGIIIITEYCS